MEQLPVFLSLPYLFFYCVILVIVYHLFIKKHHANEQLPNKTVVVIGGGFAGIQAILTLKRKLAGIPHTVILIDKNKYHLFTPSLYELATSEEPKKNVSIPYAKIFPTGVKIYTKSVQSIDPATNTVILSGDTAVPYDYLIIAAGSQPAYMNIPGLEKYGTGFKSLQDALTIKKKIKSLCCTDGKCNKKVQAIIGGGGFAGTELAAELLTYKDRIAIQHHLDKNCLELTIIQGSNHLLNELDPRVSAIAEQRVNFPNVHLAFGGHIKEVTQTQVITDNGKSYPYEILIWTGGVQPNILAKNNNFPVTHRGGLIVNNYLQVKGYDTIFAAGDVAAFVDPWTQKPAPNVAQVAEEQGATAGENVANMITNDEIKPYRFRHWGYVVPLRGYYAVAELVYNLHFTGFTGWIIQQLVLLRYLFGILPWNKALNRFDTFEMDMEK